MTTSPHCSWTVEAAAASLHLLMRGTATGAEREQLPCLPRLRVGRPAPSSAALGDSPSAQLLPLLEQMRAGLSGLDSESPLSARLGGSSSHSPLRHQPQWSVTNSTTNTSSSMQDGAGQPLQDMSSSSTNVSSRHGLLQEACELGHASQPAGQSSIQHEPGAAGARARSTARLASSGGGAAAAAAAAAASLRGDPLQSQLLEVLDMLQHMVGSSHDAGVGQPMQQLLELRMRQVQRHFARSRAAREVPSSVFDGSAGGDGLPLTYEALLQLQDVLVATPQHVLQALPRLRWGQGRGQQQGQQEARRAQDDEAVVSRTEAGPENSDGQRCTVCAVCQCDFEEPDCLLQLPCSHYFHEACVLQWLSNYSKKCPICKASVVGE